MQLKPEIVQKLSLELKLTPSLIQKLEVLQLPILKLEETIREEIESNPVIEPDDEVEPQESVWDMVFDGSTVKEDDDDFDPLNLIPSEKSISDRLLEQAKLELDGRELEIAKYIISNLDERGFFSESSESVAEAFGVSVEDVERIRNFIKTLEPVGCASRNALEAMRAQARELGYSEKLIEALNDIELFVKDPKSFELKRGIKAEDFKAMLKSLDLEPGRDEKRLAVFPDVRVWKENGRLRVEVLSPKKVRFRVNSSYLKLADTQDLKNYLRQHYQRAISLKKAIEQRNETLKRVCTEIFKRQIRFFDEGFDVLVPLSYREIADALSIHESTVSRAVKDKFVQTPLGIFPLKSFFKRSVSGRSADKIKEQIKKIIDSENKKKPYSDAKIAKILEQMGIKIARRTVAKYREELGIPGAFERKR